MYPFHFRVSPSHVPFRSHVPPGYITSLFLFLGTLAQEFAAQSLRICPGTRILARHGIVGSQFIVPEVSIHTRDESSTAHANCMNSTFFRSFSCSDWILSFVVYIIKQKNTNKIGKEKTSEKKSRFVSRSLLSLQFALLLLLLVSFCSSAFVAFARHQK